MENFKLPPPILKTNYENKVITFKINEKYKQYNEFDIIKKLKNIHITTSNSNNINDIKIIGENEFININ